MKKIAICATIAAALGLANTASAAEEYWLKTAVAAPISVPANWTNSLGVAPSVINSDDILHIVKSDSLNLATTAAAVTHDGAFHIGADDGSTSPTIRLQNDVTLNDLRWHSGVISGYRGSHIYEVAGNATLDNPSAEHRATFAASSGWAGLVFNANLSCSDTDSAIRVNPAPGLPAQSLFVLGGDNSAYIGKIRLDTATVPFELASANALGSPATARADALSVESANAVLSVKSGITPNAVRGITVSASGFRICATNYVYSDSTATPYQDCSSFELPMPISGSYGFTKTGPGTVTLSGDYTAGDIVVENGTLLITSSATFPAGQKISVASGATLYAVKSPSDFVIDPEPGAIVRFGNDTIEISYDDSTHTAASVSLDSSYIIPSGTVQKISLSEQVALPLHVAPTRQEILTIATGAEDLSAEDFVDATEKIYGLPKTSFTVEKDGMGVQHIYLNIRPVVVSVANFPNDGTLNGSESTWSNERAAESGYDYLITNRVSEIGNAVFNGDSLTIAGDDIYARGNSQISSATIYPGKILRSNRTGSHTITGNICIAGEYDHKSYLEFQARYKGRWTRLSANLSGEGPLKLYGAGVDGNLGSDVLGSPQLYGDNSQFFGRIYVTSGIGTEDTGAALEFNSANALGGALDTFKYDSLKLDMYSTLRPATSIDFSTVNRGIYGSGPFGFDVTNGITFKVGVPVKMDDIMFKHGEGDLILGGELSFGASSTKMCYVREGGIGALNDAAVAGLNMVFSNDTKIVIAPEATLVNGFTGVSFEPADAATKVNVGFADDFATSSVGDYFKAVIATVPTSASDLSSHFVLEKIRGLTGIVETESVTIGGTPCTRYSAKYTLSATTIIMR